MFSIKLWAFFCELSQPERATERIQRRVSFVFIVDLYCLGCKGNGFFFKYHSICGICAVKTKNSSMPLLFEFSRMSEREGEGYQNFPWTHLCQGWIWPCTPACCIPTDFCSPVAIRISGFCRLHELKSRGQISLTCLLNDGIRS